MHNASKVLLGSIGSSAKEVSTHDNDPATFLAGLGVCMKNDGHLSLIKSEGWRMGISLGRSLSDHKKTSVARTGESVPVRCALKRATGVITISDHTKLVSGTDDAITIAGTAFTAQAGAATPGDATFTAATGNNETAISLAAQVNAHATVALKVKAAVTASGVVTLYSVAEGIGSTGTGNDIALTYTDNDVNIGAVLSGLSGGKLSGGSDTISDIVLPVKGSKMYLHNTTSKADLSVFGTVTDAIYVAGPLSGIDESGATVPVVIVDMPGGL